MIFVSTLLRQWEHGGRVDVGHARCWVLRDRNRGPSDSGTVPLGLFSFPLLGLREGYRPYFENYTVDASIFSITFSDVVL